MELTNILSERIIKSAYMGFLLDKNANLFLEKQVSLSKNELFSFINNFNTFTNHRFNKIKLKELKNNNNFIIIGKVAGSHLQLTTENLSSLLKSLEFLIQDNIEKNKSLGVIDVFDLNTLDRLDIFEISSICKSYLATNNKIYLVDNLHLYHVVACKTNISIN